jgi:pyruvate dehydrogenase E1 component
MIPFFLFYSMFGFQRIGDLVWLGADSRARGFLWGCTAGRTTLAGEGLQHQDGHSHLLAYPVPGLLAYDPAYAFEIAVIVRDGLRRMAHDGEDLLYYITLGNETYPQPAMPEGAEEGILRGLYKLAEPLDADATPQVHLMGGGAILNEVVEAQRMLQERYGVAADVWSVTSYKQLHQDALDCDRWNMLHPEEEPRVPWVRSRFEDEGAVFVAASDYVKALPESISTWLPGTLVSLGTDGFGRSDGRDALRDYFEVDARYVVLGALHGLVRRGELDAAVVRRALDELEIDPEKTNPAHA